MAWWPRALILIIFHSKRIILFVLLKSKLASIDIYVTAGNFVSLKLPVRALLTTAERPHMKIEYDEDTCIGMFQCVAEWEGFEKDKTKGKAILNDSEEAEDGVFVREVPEDAELDAKFAARTCPVDAIKIYDDDGEQLIP